MSNIDKQALREAAEKAGSDKWQAKKINGDFYVIRNGSYEKQHGFTSYQPIAEIEHKPVRDFVAAANPATVLALLDELEAAEKRIAELEAKLDSADKLQDSAFRHGLQHGFSFGQTDNQAGFEECLSAYGARGKDNG
ncbi:ead/Ea22-like family protein [Enterobacter kobei]